jgi:hypothetical protein
MSDESDAKTTRIVLLCVVLITISAFFFAYKVEACSDKPKPVEVCRDEFFIVDNDHPVRSCAPGAKAEWVTSPPAPRPGIVCHCFNDASPQTTPVNK